MLQKISSQEISLELPTTVILHGTLTIPEKASKLVVFAHGSGSGRHSPRNQHVADVFVKEHLATLLLDLLTAEEEAIDLETREYRFNIPLLATRLVDTTHWLAKNKRTLSLKAAYFGSSTGAAAALIAAAELGSKITAVVSRGGRPDLAASYLSKVQAPTLLIVGGHDFGVIELNQEALNLLPGVKKLEIVPGATHLFEESGTLDEVARLAAEWFQKF